MKSLFKISYGSTQVGRFNTDQTPIGDQGVIPGAEKASEATLLQRRANAPLRPTRWQRPCDEGLFGNQHAQTDLIDQVRRKQ